MNSKVSHTRDERVQLRLTQRQKATIQQASQIKQTSMTSFILEQSYQAALAVVGNQQLFSLSDQAWDDFCIALESPPKSLPRLRALLTEPGVFDD
ncbi:DUF1778 domain-containing protein [Synechocystis salina LEGE 06155]|uniref:type II toxin-antitoxin system TacA family antitoxin n=1 Tax=Synechocystis sp. LEGE 06083 TaxID=915336 RepID=UPI00187FFD65|nr:DUF1778 domain-containing protein [Synechocystis sp. LEGE 06083]MBE9176135.1 DUF1778 domain-containing protein [Synechocystis salina LEGE 06155]MBE9194940.1 DUF1778 domain-containing protein [Synechocystis sp. LEGE 06083]